MGVFVNRPLRLLFAIVVSAGAFVPGCRCASGDERTQEQAEVANEGAEAEGSGDAWVAGDLAAQTADAEGEPVRGGEVTVQIYSNPPSLNTIVDSDWWAARITEHHVYESLVSPDPYDHPDYEIVPELAERWEISDDKLTYTFHLRQGVKWHDGQPFSSRDVIATMDKVMDETVKAAHVRSYFEELESYTAPDEHTVVFKWKQPYFLALEEPLGSLTIQPAHIIADLTGTQYNEASTNPLNRAPVGTGPFKFEQWQANERIVLGRNDEYWGDEAHLDRVIFRHVEDAAIALQLAEREELDVVTRITSEQWSSMDAQALRENYRRSRYYDSNYAWIGWNQQRPFFADAKVRRAMTLLIDRPRIIENLFYGLYRPTKCHFYHESPICDYGGEDLPHDPARAAELLEEAGWRDTNNDGVLDKDGVKFAFTFMIPASSDEARRMGTFMKESFGRAGIEMDLQPIEWSAFTRRLREKEFDACTLLWGSSGPRGDPTQIWHSSSIEGGSNYIGFRNERADEIMEQARVVFDPERRQEMYRDFMRILWEEQPYTFLYTRPRLSLVHERVRGVKESLMYWQYDDWWIAPEDRRRGTSN